MSASRRQESPKTRGCGKEREGSRGGSRGLKGRVDAAAVTHPGAEGRLALGRDRGEIWVVVDRHTGQVRLNLRRRRGNEHQLLRHRECVGTGFVGYCTPKARAMESQINTSIGPDTNRAKIGHETICRRARFHIPPANPVHGTIFEFRDNRLYINGPYLVL